MSRMQGVVCSFSTIRGWGFICSPGVPDVFVHYSALAGDGFRLLRKGDVVEFEIKLAANGRPEAANVVRLSGRGIVPAKPAAPRNEAGAGR